MSIVVFLSGSPEREPSSMFLIRVPTDRDTLSTEPLAKRGDSIYLFIHSFIYVGRSPQKAALLHTYRKNVRSPSTEPQDAPNLVSKVIFRNWSLAVSTIFVITHTRDGVTLQDRVPGLPSSSTRFLSHSVARSDIPGLAHSTEGLGRCDRTALVHFCTTPL